MFEEIIASKEVKFNDLEKKVYKFVWLVNENVSKIEVINLTSFFVFVNKNVL